ncbi:DUF2610 domain-containing protein [Amycolatopsis keratiniphila]|nr:DUF2610 domain-containing protein [Amycolatopsis keratiniphila]
MQHFIIPGQFGDSVAPFPIYIGEPAADAHPLEQQQAAGLYRQA